MATIKAIIAEKIRQENHGTLQQEDSIDDSVRKELEKYLQKVCFALPGENDPDKNPAGAEFAKIMFHTHRDLHDAAVSKIVEMIMEERDNFEDYPHLRQIIEKALSRNWRELCDGVSYAGKNKEAKR